MALDQSLMLSPDTGLGVMLAEKVQLTGIRLKIGLKT
jgi:hypothetical protein